MKKPNFFIVGAPKCGTTALSEYLRSHPNIFMSTPKEPHFFAEEFKDFFFKCNSINEYFKLFSKSSIRQTTIGEASVLYLYSEDAIKKIYEYNSKVKIIVMFRNPVELVYSFHSQLVYNTDETVLDFEKAWRLQETRKEGLNIPKTCRIPKSLQYKNVALIGSQYEKLISFFPEDQILTIFLDELKNDTLKTYKETLEFLNVDYDGRTYLPRINENKEYKNQKLSLIRKSNFYKLLSYSKKWFGLKNVEVLKYIHEWNVKKVERKHLSNEFRKELINEFIPEIEKLEKLLKINLNHWKK